MIKIIKIYAHLHSLLHNYIGINLRGLGFLYRFLKHDIILNVNNKYLYLNHKISDNYGRLVNQEFNEPETHLFLDSVLKFLPKKSVHFVDIGANIGEFVLDYYDREEIMHISAFEPQIEQGIALKKTIELNSISNITLYEKCVSLDKSPIFFKSTKSNSTGSGIIDEGPNTLTLYPTTIDDVFKSDDRGVFIFLIDTEGAELNIMKGGSKFIESKLPIIIFEYNFVTRKNFSINDVKDFLGANYQIFRLRKDGKLDKKYSKTWNLVAIPIDQFFEHLDELIVN